MSFKPSSPFGLQPANKEIHPQHSLSPPCSPQKTLAVIEASPSAPASPSCCKGRRHKVEMLEKHNMELVQRLRKEQETRFNKQREEIRSEHTNNLAKMGYLLSNQRKVRYFLFSLDILLSSLKTLLIIPNIR